MEGLKRGGPEKPERVPLSLAVTMHQQKTSRREGQLILGGTVEDGESKRCGALTIVYHGVCILSPKQKHDF